MSNDMMNILLIELISLWYAVMILGLKKKKLVGGRLVRKLFRCGVILTRLNMSPCVIHLRRRIEEIGEKQTSTTSQRPK